MSFPMFKFGDVIRVKPTHRTKGGRKDPLLLVIRSSAHGSMVGLVLAGDPAYWRNNDGLVYTTLHALVFDLATKEDFADYAHSSPT